MHSRPKGDDVSFLQMPAASQVPVSQEALRSAQYQFMLEMAPALSIVSIILALSVSFILFDKGHPFAVGFWLFLIVSAAVAALWKAKKRQKKTQSPQKIASGLKRTYLYSFLTGAIWGSSIFVFKDITSDIDHILLLLVVVGMSMGMFAVLAPLPLKGVLFCVTTLPPVFWNILSQGSAQSVGIVWLLVVFILAFSYVVTVNFAHFKNSLRVRLALKMAHTKLEDAIESMGEGFAIYKSDGTLLHANHIFRDMFPEGRDLCLSLANEPVIETLADGRIVKCLLRVTPSGDYVSIYIDITAARQQEKALLAAQQDAESANRAKSQFLAVMSHELRTPLNSIIGFADLICRDDMNLPKETLCEYGGYVKQSGRHLLDLISQILDLSRIEAGRFELSEKAVDIPTLIRNVVEHCKPLASDANIHITTYIDDVPGLWADERAIRQILFNLLSNAIKFSHSGGQVHVTVTCDNTGMDIGVSDKGIGIAQEDHELVFKPFQQADNTLTRQHQGSGLGLPLVRNLAELHGGTVTLQSKTGEGTVIDVHFPVDRLIYSEKAVNQGAQN